MQPVARTRVPVRERDSRAALFREHGPGARASRSTPAHAPDVEAGRPERCLTASRRSFHLNLIATLRVPETRFGPLERLLAGSSGAYLMRLLAVSTPPWIGGVALPVRGRERGRATRFAVTSSRCSVGRWSGRAVVQPIGCSWPHWPGYFLVTGGAACLCARRRFVVGIGCCSRADGRIRIGGPAGPQPALVSVR
jgi:hypothetical protein